ncbi:MAG: hypothetical protein A2033_02885 [Bacteroidetes bacterium GWA2_31_9]|nr:MAG: hypothetical protein A2033_02885 [Bacteroidetes bacterium GWA2_31_9]
MKRNYTQFYIYLNQGDEVTLLNLNKFYDEIDNCLNNIFIDSDVMLEPSEKSIENILKFAKSTF